MSGKSQEKTTNSQNTNKMTDKIQKINAALENSGFKKKQDFILFQEKELEALREATKISGFSKARTLAVGCRLLLQELEKNKNDGE